MADPTSTTAPPLPESLGDGAAKAPPVTPMAPAPQTEVLSAPLPTPRLQRPQPHTEPKGKVARVADQAKGIVEDTKEWVELRLALAKQEVRDEVEARVSSAKAQGQPLVALAVMGALAGLFALLTLSFGFSALYVWWFAPLHTGLLLGFLTTTVLLVIAALVFKAQFDRAKASASTPSES